MKKHNNKDVGLIAGFLIGGGFGIAFFASTHDALFMTLIGFGAVIGMALGIIKDNYW